MPDRLRESLFSILQPVINGAVVVDAYAGSGAVGIEALSRGAARAVFLENNRGAAAVIQANLRALGLESRSRVVVAPAHVHVAREDADIVFVDPPYKLTAEYGKCLDALAETRALVISQHPSRFEMPEAHGSLRRYRVLRQGDNSLSFYRRAEADGGGAVE